MSVANGILVTEQTDPYVLLQITDYRDDDRYNERAFDEDAATFSRALRRLAGDIAAGDAVRRALDDAGIENELIEILKASGPLVLYLTEEGQLAVMSNEKPKLQS